MLWLIGIFLIVVVIASFAASSSGAEEAQKREEFNTLTQSRVDAYADYLKRTGANSEISAMTEKELRDFIQHNIRECMTERKGKAFLIGLIIFGGIVGGFIMSLVRASFEPLVAFGTLTVILVLVASYFMNKAINTKYSKRGLDAERLRIET